MSISTEIIVPLLASDLQDTLSKDYTPAECLIYYNEFMDWLYRLLAKKESDLVLADLTPTAIAEGATSVSLPADLEAPAFLFLSGKTHTLDLATYDLKALTLTWEGSSETGEPRYGALQGSTLYVRPAADAAYTLKGKYWPRWTDAASVDEAVRLPGAAKAARRFIHVRCLNRDEASTKLELELQQIVLEGFLAIDTRRRPARSMSPFSVASDDAGDIWIEHSYE